MKEKRLFKGFLRFPAASRVALLLLITLLLALPSCSVSRTDPQADSSAADGTGAPDGSDASSPPSNTEEDPATDRTDALLSYYVSLVEELQEEIRVLKAENFILSTQNPESDAPVGSEDDSALFTYEARDGGVTILSYVGSRSDVVVPREIDGYPVVRIGDNAFSGTGITSVSLPDTVTEIGWFAFSACPSLATLTAGEALTSIGYGAFDGCPAALTLVCPTGSYLSEYGKSFGIAVRVSE